MDIKTTTFDLIQSNRDQTTGMVNTVHIGSITIEGEIISGTKLWGQLNSGIEFRGVAAGSKGEDAAGAEKQSDEDEYFICPEDFECLLEEPALTDSFLLDLGTFIIQELMDDDSQDSPFIPPK